MAKTRREKSRKRWSELAIAVEMSAIVAPFLLMIRPVEAGLLAGVAASFAVSRAFRLTLYRHHIRGERAMKRGDHERAIAEFERSNDFFARHPLVDRFRYLTAFRALRAAAQIRAIAHLTGGGWEGNLPRALADGLGAAIDRSTWTVPPVFRVLAGLGHVEVEEQWDVWNMGIGLVVIVPEADADTALRAVPDAVSLGRVERARSGERRIRFT
jgi:hypothetical protein